MKNKFIKSILIIFMGLLSIGVFLPPHAFADGTNICTDGDVSKEVKKANGCPGYNNDGDIKTTIETILKSIILVSGLVAVVFIVIGGFQYMTSAGDPGKTKKAKDTILYAAIGLIVCVLAFAIVNFVIHSILKQ